MNVDINGAVEYNNAKDAQKKKITMYIVSFVVVSIIAITITVLLLSRDKSMDSRYIGDWSCSGDVTLKMTSSGFEMIYPDANISGSYTILTKEKRELGTYFTIDFIANKRVISDSVYNSPYTTQFELGISDDNTMSMINTLSYSIYNCKRVDN